MIICSEKFKKFAILFLMIALSLSTLATATSTSSIAQQMSTELIGISKKAVPAVVSIRVQSTTESEVSEEDTNPFSDDFFRFFFFRQNGHSRPREPIVGQASGFIIKADGYILTNSHVVRDASEILITLYDGREFKGTIVGQDPGTDLAVVKIDTTDLPYLNLGDSDSLESGQIVLAIGSPFGLNASITLGLVSAKGRNNLDIAHIDFIQTDAAINKGNSGGPLIDLNGDVIGINTAIATSTGGSVGIGFAIPSNVAKQVTAQLIESGKFSRGFVGVTLQAIDQDLAQAFGLKSTAGALVSDVSKGSPAEIAGIKQGDIILSLNKQPVLNIAGLRNAIALMNPGSRITFSILREGKTIEIPVTIGLYPSSQPSVAQKSSGSKLGFEVQDLTPDLAHSLGINEDSGVVISKVDANSPAAWAGLKKGALILAVNQKKIANVDQFHEVLQGIPANQAVLLLVKQGDLVRFISLKTS